jgi:outer membrane protein assembly factor BamE
MRTLLVCLTTLGTLGLHGCGYVARGLEDNGISYRIPIQQGNVLDQDKVSQLQPGMAKRQVRYLLGTPMLVDPFHQDRWDYVYTFRPSRGDTVERRIALFFQNDQLARIEGDLRPEVAATAPAPRQTVVTVPDHEGPSLVDKALGTIGLGEK